jgi:P-type Cu2+ transporter
MTTAAATKRIQPASACNRSRLSCTHCGLPVTARYSPSESGDIFCCHACRLVSKIIGKHEHGDHTWNLLRLGIGVLLAMNVMMVSLLLYTGGIETRSIPVFRLLLLALSTPALIILIPPFLTGASLNTLIAGGSLSAFALSAVNAWRGSGEIYFDTATMLPVLVTLGKIIEASAKTRAADLLHSLESLLPATALRLTDDLAEEVAVDRLLSGDLIRIRPGERVAVDGRILEGTSTIEEASFSGEFLPRLCTPGARVLAGTVNGTGTLLVQAERTGRELLLYGIIAMIENSWRNPSRAERFAERAAALFIPIVLSTAAASALGWSLFGDPGRALLSALSVLVVACPCTMGIATPLATSLAIARAAKGGIVVRGGGVMEQIAKSDLAFFDKTGTITMGYPVINNLQLLDPRVDPDELLGRLAALESVSEHAIGKAIVAKAKACGINAGTASEVRVFSGSGISGVVNWRGVAKRMAAGTPGFVGDGIRSPEVQGNCTVIDVAWEGALRGRFSFTDTVRPDASRCIEKLRNRGVDCALLSGDRLPAAQAIAALIGIDRVEAPRDPAQKLETISAASAAGRKVIMVGDGINDAPALAAAHTGIALGAGMDLAKQAGNVVILSGNLTQIPWLIGLSERTGAIIRGNFAWSFGYNSIALIAAAAGMLHPLLAALSMVVSSLTVLGNSLRITAFPEDQTDLPAPDAIAATPASQEVLR